jgi:hypothetical protein
MPDAGDGGNTNIGRRGPGVNKTINPRRFARVKPGGRVSSAAKIVVGPKDPMIDCMLIDLSAGGACLEVAPQTALPPRFELVHGNTKKRCRLIWKAGRRIGVSF